MSVIFGGGPSQSIPPLVKGMVSGYPTELRNGGGSVAVSAAGALEATPAAAGKYFKFVLPAIASASAPTFTTTGEFGIWDNSDNTRTVLQSSRGRVEFLNGAGNAWANIKAANGDFTGTMTVTGTGTHTFSGAVLISTASQTSPFRHNFTTATGNFDVFQAQRAGANKHTFTVETVTDDLKFMAGATESFRILNASGYVQFASRIGVAVSPLYPLHVSGSTYLNGLVGIGPGQTPSASYSLATYANATNVSAALFHQGAASATVPVVVVKLGATPSTGGHGVVLRDSADKDLAQFTTVGNVTGATEMAMYTYNNTVAAMMPSIRTYRGRGTSASPAAVQSGDYLFFLGVHGYGATALSGTAKAAISVYAAENWTDAAQGAYLALETTQAGTTTRTERLRITDAGAVRIPNNKSFAALNAAGTTEYTLAAIDAADTVLLGNSSLVTNLRGSNWGYTADVGATVAGYVTAKINGVDRKLMVAA